MNYSSAAGELSSKGRNGDSMLVHMTPGEVGGLQSLAMAMGGSLTLNPDTGLPEANFLKKLLPTILGAALAATGIGAPLAAGIVGLGQTALTGDIRKGLMAGLGAFGGGSLAGAAGLGGAISNNAFGALGNSAGIFGANMGAGAAAAGSALPGVVSGAAGTAPMSAIPGATGAVGTAGAGTAAETATKLGLQGFAPKGAATVLSGGAPPISLIPGTTVGGMTVIPEAALTATAPAAAKTGLAGFGQKFGQTASAGLGKGMAAKYAPYAAGYGLLNAANEASMPTVKAPEEEKSNYRGPYLPQPRMARFRTPEEARESGGAEFSFFEDANPYPGFIPAPGMAEGGLAALPAAGDMRATMDFFNRSPGAITASMYPTPTPARTQAAQSPTTPAPAPARGRGEQQFKFAAPTEQVPNFSAGQDYFFGGMPADLSERLKRMLGSSRDSMSSMYAKGGEVDMEDGSFVVDARTVSEIGNGSSNAGIERLAAMGGRPVRGRGDGVSDSVPARIGRRQEARVARDEVIFSPQAVARIGNGSHKRGTQKLYALMAKAHKARKKAGRGQDTKVAKGLGALA